MSLTTLIQCIMGHAYNRFRKDVRQRRGGAYLHPIGTVGTAAWQWGSL